MWFHFHGRPEIVNIKFLFTWCFLYPNRLYSVIIIMYGMHLVHFFEQITTLQKLTWVLRCLFLCWLFEASIPLFKYSYNKWKHDGINLVFFIFCAHQSGKRPVVRRRFCLYWCDAVWTAPLGGIACMAWGIHRCDGLGFIWTIPH